MKKTLAVAALLVMASVAVACGRHMVGPGPPLHQTSGPSSGATAPLAVGGLSGIVGRVLMEGGPMTTMPQSPRPWPSKTIWVTDANGGVVATARSGSTGWFTVALDSGSYRLRTADARSVRFAVQAGEVTRLTIVIPVP